MALDACELMFNLRWRLVDQCCVIGALEDGVNSKTREVAQDMGGELVDGSQDEERMLVVIMQQIDPARQV